MLVLPCRSSFLAGGAVLAAGTLVAADGMVLFSVHVSCIGFSPCSYCFRVSKYVCMCLYVCVRCAPSGLITSMAPHSGHYRPSEEPVIALLRFLDKMLASPSCAGDPLSFKLDVQRIQKVAPPPTTDGAKSRKSRTVVEWSARRTLNFLCLKHTTMAEIVRQLAGRAEGSRPGGVRGEPSTARAE